MFDNFRLIRDLLDIDALRTDDMNSLVAF
jgi:hypothetical protein